MATMTNPSAKDWYRMGTMLLSMLGPAGHLTGVLDRACGALSVTRVSTPNNRKSRLRRVYSVTWVAMALVTLESSRLARRLRWLSGLRISESTMPMPMTPMAAAGSTDQGHAQEPEHHQERLDAAREVPDGRGGGRAVHGEELLEMPEPLGGLEGPVGPEEPGDDAGTGDGQRLFRDRRAEEGAEDIGGGKSRRAKNETMMAAGQ